MGWLGFDVEVEADGVPIDLPGIPRSRPYVCDWTGDGSLDLLVGAGDGIVRLYQGRSLAAVAMGESPAADQALRLQAYPNPFNPHTTLAFRLEDRTHVRLSIYDVAGRRVALLKDGPLAAGSHAVPWPGVNDRGENLPSGVYFITYQFEGEKVIQRACLLK